jgi:hypothetical protein
MNMSNPITSLQKQAYRYYYQDGLAELAVGALFAIIGLNLWLVDIAPRGTLFALAAWIVLPLLTIGGVFWVQRFVKGLKERQVFPRTGFIAYDSRPSPYRWLVMGIALLAAVLAIIFSDTNLNRESVIGGILLCLILGTIGARVNLWRLIGIGVFSLALGFCFAFLLASEHAGLALTFAGTGLCLLVSGGLAWHSYLAHNPLPGENEEALHG